MTREEAIKVLNGILHLNYRNFWDEECDEAIEMAIEALSEDKTDRMTREEAIADIKNNIKPVVGGKSLDMAIEALTHEIRTETHGVCLDLISREDALQCKPEFLNPNPNDKPNNYPIGWNDAIKVWYADIKSLPSADAVEVKADQLPPKVPTEWINDGMVLVPQHDWIEMQKKLEEYVSADAEQTDKLENQPRLVERNYTTEGGGGEIYHPTRQQGKWIPIEETLPTYDGGEKTWLTGMKCSNCGKLFDLRVGYYYCPSCGARMENTK